LREAILGGDAEAYAACYTADGFVMHQDTPYVQGTAAIKEHTQKMFDVLKVTKLDLTPVVVDGAEGVAYEVGVQEVAIDPPMDSFKPRRKHLHVYQRQEDGSWRIAAAMSSND
jgi:uncharacterized protein (TIGR02246 family)